MENQENSPVYVPATSLKSRLALTLLAFFLGELGVHRFYAGKIGTGIAMLALCIVGYATMWIVVGFVFLAVLWLWNLIDIIMAVAGKFRDSNGNLITTW